jgi:hypothetical protein
VRGDGGGVTGAAEGAVDEGLAWRGGEVRQNFLEEDGGVACGGEGHGLVVGLGVRFPRERAPWGLVEDQKCAHPVPLASY